MADILPQPTARSLLAFAALLLPASLHAQASDPKALEYVRGAVASQLQADKIDRSCWILHDHDVTPGRDVLTLNVGSPDGELKRTLEQNGKPLSPADEKAETDRIVQFVHDAAAQSRTHKENSHDDQQATALLKMLPDAFLWTIASETPELVTLNYVPNPKFEGPDYQAKVMSTMAGQLVVARKGNHIKTFRGSLTQDFKIFGGVLGRLYKGGTFDVERREVAPGFWEITETHVHIAGHVFVFHTIGEQQDEVKTDWKPSPAKNLTEAAHLLNANP